MENNKITIDEYIITYSNHLEFCGQLLSFRKKELFNLTSGTPLHVKKSNQGWWFDRSLLTPQTAKELIKHEPKQIDVSNLQWYLQIELDECFNLEKYGINN